jgi:hypothetical protein
MRPLLLGNTFYKKPPTKCHGVGWAVQKVRVAPTMEWREGAFLRRTEIKKAIILTYEQIRSAATLAYKTKDPMNHGEATRSKSVRQTDMGLGTLFYDTKTGQQATGRKL